MNEDELSQVEETAAPEGDDSLDEETMQLIAQLLQEGFTEDEIVDAILTADEESEGGEEAGLPSAEEPGSIEDESAPAEEEKKDKEPEEFARGGFTGNKPPEKKESPAPKKKDEKPAKKSDKSELSDQRLKKPANNLASIIGSLGRFN
jgi:hypothetical protein